MFFSFLVYLILPFGIQANTKPDEMLRKADQIRNPSETYQMKVEVKTEESETTFEVFLRGPTKTMIVTKQPAKDRGRNMLMLDRDFYVYVPNLKRTVRLSLAQKFSGQVANGDISRTRWFGDYDAKLLSQDKKETLLLLDGRKKNLTYQKMKLWLETATSKPLKMECLSLDGKTLLKRVYFEGYKQLSGGVRPTVLRIEDTNKKSSTLTIQSMQSTDLDDEFFTENNMETLQ